jgi:hypothetical protein
MNYINQNTEQGFIKKIRGFKNKTERMNQKPDSQNLEIKT